MRRTSVSLITSQPCVVRGKNRIASWMSGVSVINDMSCVVRAIVTWPNRASSDCSAIVPPWINSSQRIASAIRRAMRGTFPRGTVSAIPSRSCFCP